MKWDGNLKQKNFFEYSSNFFELFSEIIISKKKTSIDINQGFEEILKTLKNIKRSGNKIILIGNGASATMADHYAIDLSKNLNFKTISFNQSASLTAIGNDISFDKVFSHPLILYGEKNDLLLAISSSGNSKNIIEAIKVANRKNMKVLTLSGMKHSNKIRTIGTYNIYYPAKTYGLVESAHALILHYLIDMLKDTE